MAQFKLILRRCERSRLIAHIFRQVHEGSRLLLFVHSLFLLRLVDFGMMRADRMFSGSRIKEIIGRGKVIWGYFKGRLTEDISMGNGRKDELGPRRSRGSESHGGTDSPLIDRSIQLERRPASVGCPPPRKREIRT